MGHLSDDVGELVEFWTLLDEDRELLEGRRGATALGFALLLSITAGMAGFRAAVRPGLYCPIT